MRFAHMTDGKAGQHRRFRLARPPAYDLVREQVLDHDGDDAPNAFRLTVPGGNPHEDIPFMAIDIHGLHGSEARACTDLWWYLFHQRFHAFAA